MSLVIVNDHKVASMLASPAFRQAFSFLGEAQAKASTASQKKRGCGKCGRKNRASQTDYAQIRKQIGQMSVEQKAKMKQMLGASQVQVDYTNGVGKKIRMRF